VILKLRTRRNLKRIAKLPLRARTARDPKISKEKLNVAEKFSGLFKSPTIKMEF